jgi:hypothetical protein
MARGYKPRKRTRNEKIMIVIGLLVAISMVISSLVALFTQ